MGRDETDEEEEEEESVAWFTRLPILQILNTTEVFANHAYILTG